MAVVPQNGEGSRFRKEVWLFWHDIVDQLVKFAVGRTKNFFSKEIAVILISVRMTGEIIHPANMGNGEENFPITGTNFGRSRR